MSSNKIIDSLEELITRLEGNPALREVSSAIRGLINQAKRDDGSDAMELKTIQDMERAYSNIFSIIEDINEHKTLDNRLTDEGYKSLVKELDLLQQKQEINQDYSDTLKEIALNAKNDPKELKKLEDKIKLLKEGNKLWEDLGSYVVDYHKKVSEALGVSIDKFKELAFETDSAGKKFQSSTGFSNDFRDSMLNVSAAAIRSGVSIADASNAFQAMANNLSSFDPLASAANERMATQIALLGKLGVDANSSASSIDFLNRSMGMSADRAADLTMNLATMADGMGVTSGKMIKDFQSVSGNLAKHGKDMEKVFKNLASMAKATGIEVSTLVGLTDKFNQFDSAADSVAKLNAVLGTQMSTIEMMAMDTDEQLDYLRDNLQMTVGNFNDLDKYTQQYIATSMGFKDVGEAGRFLNMSAQEQDEYRQRAEESAKTQEKIAELTEDFLPIMERLQLSMTKLALKLSFVISFFLDLFDAIFEVDELLGGWLLPTIAAGILLLMGWVKYLAMKEAYEAGKGIAMLTKAWAGLNAKLSTTILWLGIAAAGLAVVLILVDPNGKINWGVKALTVGLVALGFGLKFASGWIGLLAGGLSILLWIFGKRINPLFVNVFAHMAVGVLALGLALKFLNGKALIGAVVLMGLFMAFAYFFNGLSESGENLKSIAVGFLLLGVSLAAVGYVLGSPYVAAGVAIFTLALIGMAAAVVIAAFGFSLMAKTINMLGDGSNLLTIAAGFLAIGSALAFIGLQFMNPLLVIGLGIFSALMLTLGVAIEKMGSGFEKMVESLSAVKGIMSELDGAIVDSFVAVTQEGGATSAVIANGSGLAALSGGNLKVDVNIPKIESPPVSVKVYLDSTELRSIIKDVMKDV